MSEKNIKDSNHNNSIKLLYVTVKEHKNDLDQECCEGLQLKKKLFVCDVEACKMKYKNKHHLKRHKGTFHVTKLSNLASVSCKFTTCYQMFSNESSMNRHYIKTHINPTPYCCNQCEDKFRRKLQLKKHIIIKHSGEFPYRCEHCYKGFLNKLLFSRHNSASHKTNVKRRTCPDCELSFEKWSILVEHRRRVHKNEPRFICDICSKTFCRKPNIKEHMKVHSSSSSLQVFQCNYDNCPKFYKAKRNLMAHIRSKHEGKRWICALCNQEKSTKQKLEQHLRAHSNPSNQKMLNKKLAYKVSVSSRIVGMELPQWVQDKLLNDGASEVKGESVVPIESTHETETSAAEFSDF